MRFSFNLPGRVTKIKVTLVEEHDGDQIQEKSYTFKREQFKVFENDYQRSAYINSMIGKDWTNPDDIREKKKEQRKKRNEEKKLIKNGEPAMGLSKEEFDKAIAEGAVMPEKGDEGGDVN